MSTKESNTSIQPSETRGLFEVADWERCIFGSPDEWDPFLLASVQLALNSPFPMTVALGNSPNNLVNIYNDGYIPILAGKHPEAFAAPVKDVYDEIWANFLKDRVQRVLAGESVSGSDNPIPLIRGGEVKEAYFDFSYSPVSDSSGNVCGAISVAVETTRAVIERRRSAMLHQLGQRFIRARELEDARTVIADVLVRESGELSSVSLVRHSPASVTPVMLMSTSPAFAHESQAVGIDWSLSVQRIDSSTVALTVRDVPGYQDMGLALIARFAPQVDVDDTCLEFCRQLRHTLLIHVDKLRAGDERVRARDEQYRALFEQSFDGILMTETGGTVYAANPAACALLGYTEDEIIALERADLIASPPEVVAEAIRIRRETGRFTGEIQYRRKDGSVITCDATSVSYDTENGERSIVLFRDATERKKIAERNERAARLEAVGQLTGGIAHDFNNILQIIIGASEDLLHSLEPGEDMDNANLIFSSSLSAAELIRQLLAFSRQQSLDARVVNATKIVRELNQILDRGTAGNIDVQFRLNSEEPVVLDPAQLESAIINLVVNAKDAVHPHGGEITISTDTVDVDENAARELECEPGRYLRVSVEDTGSGISPEDLKRVIEPFFTTKLGKGTGLGLSMVFGFVRQSGGTLKIESNPGDGTRVEMYFPVSRTGNNPVGEPQEANALPAGNGERILLVDDNQMLSDVMLKILGKLGYQCTTSPNAEDALLMISTGQVIPDLLITDVDLGRGVDGWTLITQVHEVVPDLPAIVMSGYDPAESGRQRDSAIPFIQKPFRKDAVAKAVSRVLGK